LSGQCSGIAQRCREVREELFKHLAAIESTGGVTAQLSLTELFATVSFASALISAIFSAITVGVSVYTLQDFRAIALPVLLSYSAAIFMLSLLFRWVRERGKNYQKAIGLVSKATKYHKKRLKVLPRSSATVA